MSELLVKRLNASDEDFSQVLDNLIAWDGVSKPDVEATVANILQQVRSRGDAALIEYSNHFDRRNCQSMKEFCVNTQQLQSALVSIDQKTRHALEQAAKRVCPFRTCIWIEAISIVSYPGTLLQLDLCYYSWIRCCY